MRMSPTASATPTGYRRGDVSPLPTASKAAFETAAEFCFKGAQAGVEQLPLRHDDDVDAWRKLVTTEDLSNQSFSSISLDRTAELSRRGDSKSSNRGRVPTCKERQVPTVHFRSTVIHGLVFDAAPNSLDAAEASHEPSTASDAASFYLELTVSRFRPLARRRFNTRRPFLVLIRTRNPCARALRRVFG